MPNDMHGPLCGQPGRQLLSCLCTHTARLRYRRRSATCSTLQMRAAWDWHALRPQCKSPRLQGLRFGVPASIPDSDSIHSTGPCVQNHHGRLHEPAAHSSGPVCVRSAAQPQAARLQQKRCPGGSGVCGSDNAGPWHRCSQWSASVSQNELSTAQPPAHWSG